MSRSIVPTISGVFMKGFDLRLVPQTQEGTLLIAINPTSSYMKTIPFALGLEKLLKEVIPFTFEQRGETRLEKLGGDRRKGMLSVEMNIAFTNITNDEAIRQLKQLGFTEGLEPTR
ncbi:MAG: hypothetical protein NUV56_02555 [Candidatus Uhrbacteria bacterium]|nr:hypothetical protein [Candidatus Uhrbacteria bacterium]